MCLRLECLASTLAFLMVQKLLPYPKSLSFHVPRYSSVAGFSLRIRVR
jgi:hypothetical protein